jgi:hypothetical protein
MNAARDELRSLLFYMKAKLLSELVFDFGPEKERAEAKRQRVEPSVDRHVTTPATE